MITLLLALLSSAPAQTELVSCKAPQSTWSVSLNQRLESESATVLAVHGKDRDFAVEWSDGHTLTTRFVDDPHEKALSVSSRQGAEDVCPMSEVRLDTATLASLAARTAKLPAPISLVRVAATKESSAWTLTVRPGLVEGTAVIESKEGFAGFDYRLLVTKAAKSNGKLKLSGRGSACYAAAGRHCVDAKTLVLGTSELVFDLAPSFTEGLGKPSIDPKGLALLEALVPTDKRP